MQPPAQLRIHALRGIPRVASGNSLSQLILSALKSCELTLSDGDVIVLAQKIVSKAEGRLVRLDSVVPDAEALELAAAVDKDPRLVALILRESVRVVRHRRGVMVVEDRRGLVLANAGIDHSNVEQEGATRARASDGHSPDLDTVLLLPEDPDRSARELLQQLHHATDAADAADAAGNVRLGVVICDSLGRAWRMGTTGIAIGCAGVRALDDLRGQRDLFGVPLQTTDVGHADQIAAAASIVMGQAAESIPAVLVRGVEGVVGLGDHQGADTAASLQRPAEQDLFR